MASNATVKECGVCNEEFDEEARCPRIFQCSHTLCTSCIDQLISKDTKQCPFCRRNFQANCSKDITVNQLAIEFIKHISAGNSSIEMSPNNRVPSRKRKIEDIKEETRETSSLHLVNCQEAQKQIEKTLKEVINLQKIIKEENTRIENDVQTKIQNVITQNKRIVEELERTESKLENQLKEVKCNKKELDDVEGNLNSCRANTFSESAAQLDEADETNTAIGCWIKSFKGLISEEEKTLRTNEKAIKRTREKINIIFEVLSSGVKRDGEIDIIPRMAAMTRQEDILPTLITVETLRKMSPQLKRLVEQGGLYAVQLRNGRRRCARISYVENEKLCLHHLREEPLPPNVLVIDHEEVMRVVDPSSRLTFMDLGVGGSTLGRMYIRLDGKNQITRNFSCLCSGELGPSYANTNILAKNNDDADNNDDNDNDFYVNDANDDDDDDDDNDDEEYVHEYDFVRLGDYETNDGKGGKALVAGLGLVSWDWLRQVSAGTVALLSIKSEKIAQFKIYTRDLDSQSCTTFGKVEEGLSVLTEAIAHHPNIREHYIKDCGIVLPL